MRRKVQQSIRAREQAGEIDCSRLTDDQLSDSSHFHVFPNLQLDLYSLSILSLRSRPHPTDPGRMLLDQQRFERACRGKERPRRPAHQRFVYGQGSLGTVTDQDMYNLVRVQEGLRSAGFEGLVLGFAWGYALAVLINGMVGWQEIVLERELEALSLDPLEEN